MITFDDMYRTNGIDPEILSQPNIPKPLHGVNPRSIMGQTAWKNVRNQVYDSFNGYCRSCGIHKSGAKFFPRLEAHEDYQIDYKNGIMKVHRIVPLCHQCHMFIHSGRLTALFSKGEIQYDYVKSIINHGFRMALEHDFEVFYVAELLGNSVDIKCPVESWRPPEHDIPWKDWRMIWKEMEYKPIHKNFDQWYKHYMEQ